MKKYLFFFLLFCLPIASHAVMLKDKLMSAHAGDFVVTEQNKIYSVLVVRNISQNSIELEEISVPAGSINLKKTTWRKWLDNKAPGNSSWMLYQINFIEEKLQESFSFSQNKWLYTDDTDYLLAKLLTLPLTPVPDSERRRIGPPPSDNEQDRRGLWNPPMVREGGKTKKPKYDVYSGRWPKDSSQLSECNILFYFDSENPSFPFPYWLELSNGYISLKLRTVDSGATLQSPLAQVTLPPHFNFAGPIHTIKEGLFLTLMTLSDDAIPQLYARDLDDSKSPLLLVDFKKTNTEQRGLVHFEVTKKTLSNRLKPGHTYQWILKSKSRPNMIVENKDHFVWKP